MEILSNNMKPLLSRMLHNSWSLIIYSDTLHWSGITLTKVLVTELDRVTEFDLFTKYHTCFHRTFATGIAWQQRMLTPSLTCKCFNVVTRLSETRHVSGPLISNISRYLYTSMTFCPETTQSLRITWPDVSRWTWDQRHNRKQHVCFLLGFTFVHREGRSTSYFHLWQTWRFQFPYHKFSVPE